MMTPSTPSGTVRLGEILLAIQTRQPILSCHYQGKEFKPAQFLTDSNLVESTASSLLTQTIVVNGVASLTNAQSNQLSFLSDSKYADALNDTQAGIVLIGQTDTQNVPHDTFAIVVKSPYLAYASVTSLFEASSRIVACNRKDGKSSNIHQTAVISSSATVADNVNIGAHSTIEAGANIGDGCNIGAQVVIGENVTIGAGTIIKPQVTIAHDCQIGDDCRIHAGVSIGSEGFGFAPTSDPASDGWERIAQLGRVIIGNHVRIGAQTCIDRGAIEDTVIGDNVIMDNLIQIAHNVKIGAGTAIAANTGIAGSTTIGKRCLIGGGCNITGHIEIVDDVTVTSTTYVTQSIKQSGSYSSGTVVMPTNDWRRATVKFRRMGKK